MVNLSKYQSITQNFEKMFDGIREVCSYKGKILGVPLFSVEVSCWEVDAYLQADMNIKLPQEQWTWEQFYEIAQKTHKDTDWDGKPDVYALIQPGVIPPFMDTYECENVDYIKGKVSFRNQEFIKLLKMWKRVLDEGLVLTKKRGEPLDNEKVFFKERKFGSVIKYPRILIPKPVIKNRGAYPTYVQMLCVNKNSENIDKAVELLAYLISPDIQLKRPFAGLYSDVSKYDFTIRNTEAEPIDEKGIALLKDIRKQGVRSYHNKGLRSFQEEIIAKFISGQISAEEAAKQIEVKAKMIIEE